MSILHRDAYHIQHPAKSMANHTRFAAAPVEVLSTSIHIRLLLILLILIVFGNSGVLGGKSARIHIPDELDDVVDEEEDEAWKEWGRKKKVTEESFDPPPEDFSEMDLAKMQDEMMKRQYGPSFGFVKLRLGVRRTPVALFFFCLIIDKLHSHFFSFSYPRSAKNSL